MFDIAPTAQPVPLPQSVEFSRALKALGISTRWLPMGIGQGNALLQSTMLPILGEVGLISRGPVDLAAMDPDTVRETFRAAKFPLLVNADAGGAPVLSAAGLVQVMTPATLALLDLSGGAQAIRRRMHGKWRNRLRRAEEGPLRVRATQLPDAKVDWLLRAEAAQRMSRGYRGLPPALATAFAQGNPGAAQVFEALHEGAPVAGMVILRHGSAASYFMGVTSAEGRAMHAHTLLLARAVGHLSEGGAVQLDLGTLDTENAAGLARFKLGSGAQAHRLGGTWLYARWLAGLVRPKRPWRPRGSP